MKQIGKLKKRLLDHERILMDGATGTEILNRGFKTTLPLWSAEVLLTHPQVVQEIYEDYIKAGAEIIVTDTFSTMRRVFAKKHIAEKSREATLLACQLAEKARQKVKADHDVFIAGSVSPLEDCYLPELTPPDKELAEEHLEFAQDLKDGGVDFILIETMVTLRETLAALRAAKKVGLPVAVSFCINEKLELLGGETLGSVLPEIEKFDPLFIGINCVSQEIAIKGVKYLVKNTSRPVCAYAQGDGAPDDEQGWRFDAKEREEIYLRSVKKWIKDGAQVVGGCCGTTPEHIRRMHAIIET